MKQFKAKLHLKPHLLQKFIKARPVPFAVRPKVEAKLERLEKFGVLEKVGVAHCQPLSGCRQTFSPLSQVEKSSPSWT